MLSRLQQQVEELQKRLGEQEQRNADLEARLQKQEASVATLAKDVTPVIQAAAKTPEKPAVRSKYEMDIYGFIKVDAAYDTDRMDAGNFARWVVSEDEGGDDDDFSITANQSRLGLNVKGPDLLGGKTSGKIEVDFYEAVLKTRRVS